MRWAVERGVADEERVANMGGSYGWSAALVGLTCTPKTFACGVDIVGPSNLVTLLRNIPSYWTPMMPMLTTRVGNPDTEEGWKLLLARSPLSFVYRIERPLLIGHRANDPWVKPFESDQVAEAMRQKGIPVTYVLYPDEGYGLLRASNRTSFNAVAEVFLAQCLGGPYQPFGADLTGASITIAAGEEHISGLSEALAEAR